MPRSIIISNQNELVRMQPERVIYVASDGNYSTFFMHDKSEQVFTMNLARSMEELERQLGREAQTFIRIGKSLIVNRTYIYRVNVQRQQLVLSDMTTNQAFTLSASKEALRQLKDLLEKTKKEERL